MSYIRGMLAPSERIVYETELSNVIYAPCILALALILGAGYAAINYLHVSVLVTAAVATLVFAASLLLPWLSRNSCEFMVTDKRVIMKTGIIARRIFEMRLDRIESIDLDQGILGRLLNYGSVTVRGTGSAAKVFHDISDPQEFKHVVSEAQEMAAEKAREEARRDRDGNG